MMRGLLLRRTTLLAALLLIALILCLPMRLAASWLGLEELGISARGVSGSIWNAELREARVGNLPIGDVKARLSPLALFTGRARVAFSRDGEGYDRLSASVSIGPNRVELDKATARIALGSTLAPLPMLAIHLDDVSAEFRQGICKTAEGRVRAEIDGSLLGLALAGGLSGNARCDGGALLLPLVSQSAMEAVSIRFSAGNRYAIDFFVRPDGAGGKRLLASGFMARGGSYRLQVSGRP